MCITTNRSSSHTRTSGWLAASALMLLCGAAQGQAVPTPAPVLHPRVAPNEAILPGGKLGPDDLIEISVTDCQELSRNFRVSSDGSLSLPLLPKPLPVAGLTPVQVAENLKAALIRDQLLTEPVVSVSVLEYRSRPVSVMGAVNHPITFQATGHTTLLDALATAGGLSPTAGGNILVTGIHGGPPDAVRTIPVRDLIGGAVPADNLQLLGGEDIRIPEGDKVFVSGNVLKPGMYPMQSDSETTVIKAITLSSGLAPFTAKEAFIYRRRANSNERDEVKIALNQIMRHQIPDVALHPDDILYIPTSDGKKMASRIFTQMTGVGQAAAGYAIVR